jgi:2-keto-4-pentenoate hydratase/2-oxohepta-3-ene-1,7-dioic acid hydratase in catechol pathway
VRLVVFDDHRVGLLERGTVHDLTSFLPAAPPFAHPARVNELFAHFDELRAAFEVAARRPGVPLDSVRLLAPCPAPRNFLAAPLNYGQHGREVAAVHVTTTDTARELGFFVKATGSISGPADPIELPLLPGRRFDHEAEVGVVIGREARSVPATQALDYVFGYTLVVDVTLRMTESHREERPMRKSYATFGPVGPWITTADEIPDPSKVDIALWVNGDLRQQDTLASLIVDVPELISRASSVLPLLPGDLYATGTPAGIGPIEPGDEVVIESSALGRMRLPVVERSW